MDLMEELEKKLKILDASVRELSKTSKEFASAYMNYRIALAKELVRLKDGGMPVTIAYDVARGKPEIAKLKFDEIVKEAIYKANQETINAVKLELRLIENQISREYSSDRYDI